jgi:hypothetical protein
MNRLTIIALCFILASCNQQPVKSAAQQKAELDSFAIKKYGRTVEDQAKHMTDSVMQKALFDTVGLYKSPVKIIYARLVKKEYSNYKDIELQYKNVSKKPIDGIKFTWYGLNVFGEPADMGTGIVKGFGSGFSDEHLSTNQKTTSQWSILSGDGKKVVLAWPTEVVFTDGTKWKINSN